MINIFGSAVDPWMFWTFVLVLIGTLITILHFIRDWWTNRKRLIIKTSKLIPKDEIMTTVINRTGEQIKFHNISFICEKKQNSFMVPSGLHTFNGASWGVDDGGRPCAIIDTNTRYTFWLSIKAIKKRHSDFNRTYNHGRIKRVIIFDFHGRDHEGRILRSIKKLLNNPN